MSDRPRIGLRFAWRGVVATWRSQVNFRIQVGAAVLAVAAALWLGARVAPIALASGLVLALELVNTAVEAAVDLASPEPHPLAAVAKDAAAGAVLVASLVAVVVGGVELGPPLLAWLAG